MGGAPCPIGSYSSSLRSSVRRPGDLTDRSICSVIAGREFASAEGDVQMRTPAASADVVVVGLGAMGSHALWRLAERGVRAIGVEQFTPGHDRGSSHGESRIIRTAYSEGAGYVPLVLHAWRLWDELEARSGQRLLERCGGLMLGSPSSPWVRGATESAKDHGLRYELLSGSELRERFPQHRVDDDDTVGFFEAAAGVVRPERGVVEAVRAARAAGAEVLEGETVLGIVPDGDRPAVQLSGRTLVARHVVVAAGAWVPRLVPGLDLRLRVVRRVQAWFETPSLEAFSPKSFPVFLRHQPGGEAAWYGCPSLDGATVKVGLHTWPALRGGAAAGPPRPDPAGRVLRPRLQVRAGARRGRRATGPHRHHRPADRALRSPPLRRAAALALRGRSPAGAARATGSWSQKPANAAGGRARRRSRSQRPRSGCWRTRQRGARRRRSTAGRPSHGRSHDRCRNSTTTGRPSGLVPSSLASRSRPSPAPRLGGSWSTTASRRSPRGSSARANTTSIAMAASPSSRASWVIARGTLADRANFSGSDAAHAATTERSGGR